MSPTLLRRKPRLRAEVHFGAEARVFETVDECMEGTLRSSYERGGVCFGGFRPTNNVEEPCLRAVTPACRTGRHFGVQARALARGGLHVTSQF
jgi:hypothetical protein